jgi:hypothetical protein
MFFLRLPATAYHPQGILTQCPCRGGCNTPRWITTSRPAAEIAALSPRPVVMVKPGNDPLLRRPLGIPIPQQRTHRGLTPRQRKARPALLRRWRATSCRAWARLATIRTGRSRPRKWMVARASPHCHADRALRERPTERPFYRRARCRLFYLDWPSRAACVWCSPPDGSGGERGA